MFDDQQIANQSVPPNLPIGEPEDMFADVDTTNTPVSTPASDPTPVSSFDTSDTPIMPSQTAGQGLSTAMDAGKLRPKTTLGEDGFAPAGDIPQVVTPPPQSAPMRDMHTLPDELRPSTPPLAPEQAPYAGISRASGDMRSSNIGRTILLIVLILVGATILGTGIWYGASLLLPGTPNTVPTTPAVVTIPEATDTEVSDEGTATLPTNTNTLSPSEAPDTIPRPSTTSMQAEVTTDTRDNQILFGDTIDTDEDDLSDEKEIEFGTDPRNWDTDGDGLGDGVEVLNWGTDPLNPDTDGDGYADGAEVASGYSPIAGGGARLFETRTSSTSNTTP